MKTVRLTAGDVALAKRMLSVFAAVFDEPGAELTDDYLVGLLSRPGFWAIAAIDGDAVGDAVVGGVTAHTLPMTRSQSSEIFIYDLAVRSDRQRQGIGRSLIAHLREAAGGEGIDTVFVPADDGDDHAIEFYRAIGGDASPVTFFTFDR